MKTLRRPLFVPSPFPPSLPKKSGEADDRSTAKKAMARPTSAASKRSNSAGSSAPGLNIKQKIVLSTEQQKVLSHVVAEGKNIFFTGSAGESCHPC